MPSVSAKQHRFMEAIMHDPQFARKAGVPQSVGQEFVAADEAKARAPRIKKPSIHAVRLASALRTKYTPPSGGY